MPTPSSASSPLSPGSLMSDVRSALDHGAGEPDHRLDPSAPDHLRSLPEAHRTIDVSHSTVGGRPWWRRFLAFAGPGYLVSVGYMDPGNWATDLAGGAQFGYALIWVILLSNLMAMFLQSLCVKLGVVTGRDLAQACREQYSKPVAVVLWFLCEIAIIACDLAEVIGSAVALNLLFGIPLVWGVILTGFDVMLLLAAMHFGFRKIEAIVLTLVSTVALCFALQIFLAQPDWGGVALGMLVPTLPGTEAFYIALGILGATVMPHNLYLHTALVQTRDIGPTVADKRQAVRYNITDTVIALGAAFFVNAAILIVAAAVFFRNGQHGVSRSCRKRTACSRRCSARRSLDRLRGGAARFGPVLDDHRHARRARSSWRASCRSASAPGCAASSRACSPSCRRSC
jgi:manganese transport protein